MPSVKNEIIPIKKTRKDGSLEREVVCRVVDNLKEGSIIVLPVDSVFGILAVAKNGNEKKMVKVFGERGDNVVRLINSFKMLDELASYDKTEFDFLHRVWPGEVVVRLRSKLGRNGSRIIPVRFPKNKFIQDIISQVDQPLLFGAGIHFRKKRGLRIKDIYRKYQKADMIILVEEFCKKHPFPTIIDVTEGALNIIDEGRISADEIKSLYFL